MQGFKDRVDAFLRHEAAGGIVLLAAAVVALLLSNSPLAWAYDAILNTPGSKRQRLLEMECFEDQELSASQARLSCLEETRCTDTLYGGCKAGHELSQSARDWFTPLTSLKCWSRLPISLRCHAVRSFSGCLPQPPRKVPSWPDERSDPLR
jgi:hypothetical protein